MDCLYATSIAKCSRLRASYIAISNILRQKQLFRHRVARSWTCNFSAHRRVLTVSGTGGKDIQKVLDQYKTFTPRPGAEDTQRFSQLYHRKGKKNVVTLVGYMGKRRDASKKLSFTTLISANMDETIQLVSTAQATHLQAAVQASVHEAMKAFPPNSPVRIVGDLKPRQRPKDVECLATDTDFHLSTQAPSEASTTSTTKDTDRSDAEAGSHHPTQEPSEMTAIKKFEIEVTEAYLLNDFPKDIIVTPETVFPPEQRHLQLRTDLRLRWALKQRSQAMKACRKVLTDKNFLEIETPLLFKSTPEGAREFIVPTRQRGLAYALPQSPQQYKQILMASGIRKYFQFAKCFRDEDHRADRQPEFTQLDLEMSFATRDHVINTVETIIGSLWYEALGVHQTGPNSRVKKDEISRIPLHFDRITYQDAMSIWGSDKPDTRYGWEISSIENLPDDLIGKITPLRVPTIDAMKVCISDDANVSRNFISDFLGSANAAKYNKNVDGAPGIAIYDSTKPLQGLQVLGYPAAEDVASRLELDEGDVVVLQARKKKPFSGGSTMLGDLRRDLHKAAVDTGLIEAPEGWSMLWITDFPLFSPTVDNEPGQGGGAGLASTHHPFTAPRLPADVDLLLTDPTSAIGDHYDLVINGVEIGGGSRRIHHHKMQEFVLRDVLKVPEKRMGDFAHLLEALRAGCPPHAGIALGFDRLMAVMLGRESVRDVIAFPKSGKGDDPMVKSPSPISEETLETYHLMLKLWYGKWRREDRWPVRLRDDTP